MYKRNGSFTWWGRIVFELFGLIGLPFRILSAAYEWASEKWWNQ